MRRGTLRVLLAGLLLAALGAASGQRTPIGPLYGPVPVAAVRDGDTLVVASNVGPRTVRLIGVDAPETQHPTVGREPFGGRRARSCVTC
jgi:endonuclease YncB( thermonuclease family)